MATYTENYNLIKPDETDYYEVSDFNENFDSIDTFVNEIEQNITGLSEQVETSTNEISEKIGSSTDTDSNTIFGQLHQITNNAPDGLTAIKSIQYVTSNIAKNETSTVIAIKTVVPKNSIILFERLYDENTFGTKVMYTLNSNNITCTHISSSSWDATFGFWIIEFC